MRPKIKLKAMHWDKLDTQSSQYTIWSHMMLDANELASILKDRGLLDEIERVFQHKESKLRFGAKAEKSGKKELMGNDLRQKFGISINVLCTNCEGVALYSYQSLPAMDFVIKVLHCEVEIIENETLMNFLADEKVSDNEAIVRSFGSQANLEKFTHALPN